MTLLSSVHVLVLVVVSDRTLFFQCHHLCCTTGDGVLSPSVWDQELQLCFHLLEETTSHAHTPPQVHQEVKAFINKQSPIQSHSTSIALMQRLQMEWPDNDVLTS